MRVQQYANAKMRAGNQQGQLLRLWGRVVALVVEAVSMVDNMLEFRTIIGRRQEFRVGESNY